MADDDGYGDMLPPPGRRARLEDEGGVLRGVLLPLSLLLRAAAAEGDARSPALPWREDEEEGCVFGFGFGGTTTFSTRITGGGALIFVGRPRTPIMKMV